MKRNNELEHLKQLFMMSLGCADATELGGGFTLYWLMVKQHATRTTLGLLQRECLSVGKRPFAHADRLLLADIDAKPASTAVPCID